MPEHTIADLIAQRGALPAVEAVGLMVDVLAVLPAARAANGVQRELRSTDIVVDASGRAQLMKFGAATPMRQQAGAGASAPHASTPAHLASEVIPGSPVTPAVDVFSAGMILADMLAGRSLSAQHAPDPADARGLDQPLGLLENLGADVDVALRAIVRRAIARDPSLRHADPQSMHQALVTWLAAAPGGAGKERTGSSQTSGDKALESLMQRMRHSTDFPALSNSVGRIQGIVSSDTESVASLTNEILKDVALTNKLLRLVNSVHFTRSSGGISTVSRAVNLVGFNGIRNMALGLVLLEHMQDKAHADDLKDEFVRCLMAGAIAAELCVVARESEEAFIAGMFQSLGRLLAEFYFPEETRAVRSMVRSAQNPVTEALAAAQILGLDFAALGIGVAKVWGLPDGIQRCMHKPEGQPPLHPPSDASERLRWISTAANALADVMLRGSPAEVEAQLAACGRQHAKVLGFDAQQMAANILSGRQQLVALATAMQLQVRPGSGAAKLLQLPAGAQAAGETLDPLAQRANDADPGAIGGLIVQHDALHVTQTLSAGIQDVTNAAAEGVGLGDLLRMVLETMFRAVRFERIVFCLRDPKTNTLTGRFGLGQGIDTVVQCFQVALRPTQPNLFATVCNRGVDTLISDATEPRVAGNLPPWYRKSVNATAFLLLPLNLKDKPFGLIYADMGTKAGAKLDDQTLSLLRTLRDQAVAAFKHGG